MKKDIADAWVATLRSDLYAQGRDVLANATRTKHCCLGVLCEIAIENGVEMEVAIEGAVGEYTNSHGVCMKYDGEGYRLPDAVRVWADMMFDDGRLYDEDTEDLPSDSLADLNDSGASFKEIADHIEEYWEAL